MQVAVTSISAEGAFVAPDRKAVPRTFGAAASVIRGVLIGLLLTALSALAGIILASATVGYPFGSLA